MLPACTCHGCAAGLAILDANGGEIWAKLDAGTEDYYRLVNRSEVDWGHVLENLREAAQARPIVIQSLFLRDHGEPPAADEIAAYVDRLEEILAAGGQIEARAGVHDRPSAH